MIQPFTDLLPPTISTFEDGDSVAGQTLTLLCRVILPEGLITPPQIAWLSPQGSILTSEGELTVGNQELTGNPSRLSTYMVQFSSVLTSHGGTYTCQATVSSLYGTIQKSVFRMHNVSVQSKCKDNSASCSEWCLLTAVPPPVLTIAASTTNVYAGSFITFNCSAQLSSAVDSPVTVTAVWKRNDILFTSSAHRMVSDVSMIGNSSLYLAEVFFNPVQLNTDDGAYVCEITVDTEIEFVVNTGLISNNLRLRARGVYKYNPGSVILCSHFTCTLQFPH